MQVGLAQMLKGGVIMDVTTAAEARIAEEAGVKVTQSTLSIIYGLMKLLIKRFDACGRIAFHALAYQ